MAEEINREEYGQEAEVAVGLAFVGGDAKRYVLFHENYGVLIEGDLFSYNEVEACKHDRVITYIKFQADNVCAYLKEKLKVDILRFEVTPDRKFGCASIEACVALGLPRWFYNEAEYGRAPEKDQEDVPEDEDSELPKTPESGD